MRSVFLQKPDPDELRRHSSVLWQLWVWLPAALAVVCIAIESTGTFSSQHTSGWLRPFIEHLFGAMPDGRWDEIHHLIRKTGHFAGYGTVCLTFLRAWLWTLARRLDLGVRSWRLRATGSAILSTAAIASLDEIHQTMLPSRTGQFSDVVLDTCGGAAACLLVLVIFWRRTSGDRR